LTQSTGYIAPAIGHNPRSPWAAEYAALTPGAGPPRPANEVYFHDDLAEFSRPELLAGRARIRLTMLSGDHPGDVWLGQRLRAIEKRLEDAS